MDAIACEKQFIDHLAPIWRALPQRGRFLTNLPHRALDRKIEPELIDIDAIKRKQPLPPKARPGDGPIALTASVGDIKLGRRLGYRKFIFIEHGAGQSYAGERGIAAKHPSYPGGMDREDVGLFLCPNEYSAEPWRTNYPHARVEVVGSPRLNDLPARDTAPDDQVVAISFHWPAFVCPESDTALGHYMKSLAGLADTFNGKSLAGLANNVIGHAHPKGDWPQRMKRIYDRVGIEFVRDFDEVCRRADVYVCDNSSTIFEFAATGRPVVVLNSPKYRRNVHHGGRFWDWATVGVQVDEPSELVAGIQEALADAPERRAERERVVSQVYAYRGAEATQRAVGAILDWLGAKEEVAA